MDAAAWGFIGAVVGTVVGASTSILTTLLSGRNSARLQEKADTLERLERAREFQRNNLLELQDSIFQSMRLIVRVHLEDIDHYRKGEDSKRSNLLSEELSQELMISNRKMAILTERIADSPLRNNLRELRQEMTGVLIAKSKTDSKEKLDNATNSFDRFMLQLGIVLRNNY